MCDDPELCRRAGRHIHGKQYELYQNNEQFRKFVDKGFKEPNIIRKVASFIQAGVSHLIDGREATNEEIDQRMSICKSCEHFNKERETCKICGCACALKASWLSSNCPLNKWPTLPLVPPDSESNSQPLPGA